MACEYNNQLVETKIKVQYTSFGCLFKLKYNIHLLVAYLRIDFGPSQPNLINRHQPHQLIIRKGIIYVTIMLNVDYGHCIMLNINYCHCIRFANLLLDLIAVITSQINICYCKWFALLVIKLPIGNDLWIRMASTNKPLVTSLLISK
jgi:hypothetical protein